VVVGSLIQTAQHQRRDRWGPVTMLPREPIRCRSTVDTRKHSGSMNDPDPRSQTLAAARLAYAKRAHEDRTLRPYSHPRAQRAHTTAIDTTPPTNVTPP
jgi:hypothetical protein